MTTATATLPAAPITADGLPQLAEKPKPGQTPESFDPTRYIAEPKLDGWRILVHRHDDGVSLYSRTGKSYTGCLPEIEDEMAANLPPGTWLDCEAHGIRVDAQGNVTHDWSLAQKALGGGTVKPKPTRDPMMLMAFDLLAHGGIDARKLPYARRRALLEQLAEAATWTRIMVTPQVKPTTASFEALLATGYEGMMIKDQQARYASGQRGAGWIKIKPNEDADVVIMGYKPGKNGLTGYIGSVVFGAHDASGNLVEMGSCSGMSMKKRAELTKKQDENLGKVMEIHYLEKMPTGGLRSPNFDRIREDKNAADCKVDLV